jgi:hypothetical protein
MTFRGFNQGNLGRATITKIINSTIAPILTYGLEAFPLKDSDYENIDKTMLNIISQTTKHTSSCPPWDFHEQHITPPSMTIKRNKIALFIKASRGAGLENTLYNSFPDNFLTKEIRSIEKEWGFDLEEYMMKYKGKKLIPKEALKDLLQSRIETKLEECLNFSTWNVYQEKQFPAPLPLHLHNPPPELLTIRIHTLLPPSKKCPLCGSNPSSPTIHALLECQHSLCLALRYQLWQAYQDAEPDLKAYIKSSPPLVATRVMTGLQLLNSPEANASVLKVAVSTLCKNYTEAGFVGAPRVGASRAERAPQLSVGS